MRAAIAPLFMLMKQTPPQLPVWGYADRILGAFNDKEASADFAGLGGFDLSLGKNLGLKGGSFEVVIIDEDSKINVNMGASNEIAHIRLAKQLMSTMAPIQYNPLFEQRDSTGNYNDRLSVCSALIDWADPDEQLFSCDTTNAPSSNAVEDGWYQLLAKPYRRKNAPYDSLEELHMVRGVTDDFWSTFVDPDPTEPEETPDDRVGAGRGQREHCESVDALRARLLRRADGGALHRSDADADVRHGRHDGPGHLDGRAHLRHAHRLHPDDEGAGPARADHDAPWA